MFWHSLVSLNLGLIAGFLYGCSFALQQRSTFALPGKSNQLSTILHGIGRITLLAFCTWALLRSPQISPILFFVSFVVVFWLVVTRMRACHRA